MKFSLLFIFSFLSIGVFSQSVALAEISKNKGFSGYTIGKKMKADSTFSINELYETPAREVVKAYWFIHDGSVINSFYGIPIQSITIATNTKKKIDKISVWFANDYSREKNDENLDSLSTILGPYKEMIDPENFGDRSLHRVWHYKKIHLLLHYYDSESNKSGLLSLHISKKKMHKKNRDND